MNLSGIVSFGQVKKKSNSIFAIIKTALNGVFEPDYVVHRAESGTEACLEILNRKFSKYHNATATLLSSNRRKRKIKHNYNFEF